MKAQVVVADERETTGLRAVLNYGHTFAHAFENVSGYGELLHGEAVSLGMECAARLAHLMNRIDDNFIKRQTALLKKLNLPTSVPTLDREKLWQAMSHDKKVEHGELRFILPTRMGKVEFAGGVSKGQALAAIK